MERKAREEMARQKKKVIAFKFTPTISDDDDEEEDDEELSLLVKNVRRMYNKTKFSYRKKMARKRRQEDHMLQLPEVGPHGCELSRD